MNMNEVKPIRISGSTYSASASAQYPTSGIIVSGTTSAFNGPHLIETQSLNIEYRRVPANVYIQSTAITLSSCSVVYTYAGTRMMALVFAEYRREKSNATFSTSGYQQPQKFEIAGVSADAGGITYGDLTTSTLGPAGQVTTIQPYVSRIPWDDNIHSEVVRTTYSADFAFKAWNTNNIFVNGTGNNVRWTIDQISNWNEFERYIRPSFSKGATINVGDEEIGQSTGNVYNLNGTYNTNQETQFKMISWIESISAKIAGVQLYSIPCNETNSPTPTPIQDQGFAEYTASRHDYSDI